MRRVRRAAASFLLLAMVAVPSAPGFGQVGPSISLDPTEVAAGGSVLVAGSGFTGDCGVDLYLDAAAGDPIGFAFVDDGSFSTEATIPAGTPPGAHTVIAVGLAFAVEFCGGPSGNLAGADLAVQAPPYDRSIHLQTRRLDDPGVNGDFLDGLGAGDPIHGIVQLQTLPSEADLETLQGLGIRLLAYLGGIDGIGTSYLALLSPPVDAADPAFDRLVRGLQPILPEDKRSLLLPPPGPGEVLPVTVVFFPDVPAGEGREVLAGLGVQGSPVADGVWEAAASPDQIQALAESDPVQWVDLLTARLPTVDESRQLADVDDVQQLNTGTGVYAGRSGNGVQIGIMDTGVDTAHADFAGRIVRVLDDGGDHGSHVAGIAAGSGAQSNQLDAASNPNGGTAFQWRGMAPRAGIAAYPQIGGNAGQFLDAIVNFGVDVSNHSYIMSGAQGLYNADPQVVDRVVRGDSPGVPARPVVWAAANNASAGPRDCNNDGVNDGNFPQYPFPAVPPGGPCPTAFQAGYFSILGPCKNCIGVGSVDDDQIHTFFSSMGPTMDGRLKPDVVASGRNVFSVGSDRDNNGNPVTANGYRSKSGTSMAAPAVAGIVALILEQYAATFGVNLDTAPPLPSTSKAILVQTAADLAGTDPTINFDTGAAVTYGAGPDWATGFGLVQAEAAVDMVADRQFLEDRVDGANHTDQWWVPVTSGQATLRVTLAWDDREGTPNANAAAAMLVNDLDLEVVDPNGVIHRPLVLPLVTPRDCDGNAGNGTQVGTCIGSDAAGQNYAGPAAEGIDRRNNVERVEVANPVVGNWRVRVSVRNADGTVRLPLGGDQRYSLAGVTSNQPPTADAGGPYATVEGTDVTLSGSGTDPEGAALSYAWDLDGDGAFDDATGATATFDRVGQDGAFVVRLQVTDPGGLVAVDQATVTVANVAPTIAGLANTAPQPEGAAVSVTGTVRDPGWLEALTATIDWGDGAGPHALAGTLENLRPDATLAFAAGHVYGDNGTFTVTVCGFDDDTSTCASTSVAVANVVPSLVFDTSGAVPFPGGPAFFGRAGVPQDHTASATDPGSDDLTFTWSFGTTTTYFNNGLSPDPFPSPFGTFPFAASDTATVTFPLPGAYTIGVSAADDDGGTAAASFPKVVVGNEERTHPSGWWKHQYRGTGMSHVDQPLLDAYLDIIEAASGVFSEVTSIATIDDAGDVLSATGSDKRAAATADLLVAWLHFASGAVGWTDPVPVGGGQTRPYNEVIAEIESIVLDPNATNAALVRASQLAQRTFLAG